MSSEKKLLSVKSLNIFIDENNEKIQIVNNLDFELEKGEITGLVGESGSGKSMTALSIMNLMPNSNFSNTGKIIFDGQNLCALSKKERRGLLGKEMSMIFQDPMTSLNPLINVGKQIAEPLILHYPKMTKKEIKDRVVEVMKIVELPNPEKTIKMYPHELSGGLRQRVMIAIAIICSPKLIIADEPTTALDVVTQKEILDQLKKISKTLDISILFISHDLGVVKNICDNIVVIYAGTVMEKGNCKEVLNDPKNEYTKALLQSIPTPDQKGTQLKAICGYVPKAGYKSIGCPFANRCSSALDFCFIQKPININIKENHSFACFISQRSFENNE